MKFIDVLLFCTFFISVINSNLLRNLEDDTNLFDYTNYKYVKSNENISDTSLSSTNSDESIFYFTDQLFILNRLNLNKPSADTSNDENSEFYCVNSVLMAQGGDAKIRMYNSSITSSARGASGICITNNGKVGLYRTNLTLNGPNSKGLLCTYGGSITATLIRVATTQDASSALTTYLGVSHIICNACILSTQGRNSSLIYSSGNVMVYSGTTGSAANSQLVVCKGKGSASIEGNSAFSGTGRGMVGTEDSAGVLMFKEDKDLEEGTTIFNCQDSYMEILSSSPVYKTAPMILLTNTDDSQINLERCKFSYGSDTFLKMGATSYWGKTGQNCGKGELNLKDQELNGNIMMDDCSELVINMINSSLSGVVNPNCGKLTINMDKTSTITLGGNSCYTVLNNEGSGNIKNQTHEWINSRTKDSFFNCCFSEYIQSSLFLILLILL